MTIHHIKMDQICSCYRNPVQFFAKPGTVGREQGRGDFQFSLELII